MTFGVRIRLLEILIGIRFVGQRTALEAGQLAVMTVVEDRLGRRALAPFP